MAGKIENLFNPEAVLGAPLNDCFKFEVNVKNLLLSMVYAS